MVGIFENVDENVKPYVTDGEAQFTLLFSSFAAYKI